MNDIEGEGGEPVAPAESRFGDEAKIVEAMKTGEVVEVGTIEELYPDTPEHQNEVNIVDIGEQNANQVVAVEIQDASGGLIRCIFKPAKGEDIRSKREMGIEGMEFYPRECAAYAIDKHFGFGLVPPTVIREVNGQIGSLQLFLDHDKHATMRESEDEATDKQIYSGKDWQAMAVLDWILANVERHPNNIMFSRQNPDSLFAIDHGISMNSYVYFNHTVRGPSLNLTCIPGTEEKPRKVDAPQALVEQIKRGMERRDELTPTLEAFGFKDYEIEAMWQRCQDFVDNGIFLSKYNYKLVTGRSPLSIDYYKK